jgi:uncharacterized protein (DUF3820 family)
MTTDYDLLYCGHCQEDVEYKVEPSGKHIKATCLKCDSYIKFITHTDAADFQMPFGKYKGETLLSISKKDKGYLLWILENIDSKNIKEKINLVLLNKSL